MIPYDGTPCSDIQHEIRYSLTPINEDNWDSAIRSGTSPVGGRYLVRGLDADTLYYFAMKAFIVPSEAIISGAHESGLSNVVSATTWPEAGTCPNDIAQGEQIYFVSTPNNPQFLQVVINPLDVQVGETALMTVKVRDTEGNSITSVTVWFITDNLTGAPVTLSLISGTDVDGTWQGLLTMHDDTNCTNYQISFSATGTSGTSLVTLSIR